MSQQTVNLAQWGGIIVALIGVLGTWLGAALTAHLALRNYRDQKEADRDYYKVQKETDRDYYKDQKETDRQDANTKARAKIYKKYLTAYASVMAWPEDGDPADYAKRYEQYYDAYHDLFQVAEDDVFEATTAFHQIAWREGIVSVPAEEEESYKEKWKKAYAQMLIAMRADAFEKTDLPVEEIAQRLPWYWGDKAEPNRRATAPERLSEPRDEERDPGSRELT
jgi:hypothetical protein